MTDDQSIDVALLYTQLGISLGADQDVMYTLLGDTYEDMKRYDKALDAYQKVPATSPLRVNADMEEAVSLQQPRPQGRGAGQAQGHRRGRPEEL